MVLPGLRTLRPYRHRQQRTSSDTIGRARRHVAGDLGSFYLQAIYLQAKPRPCRFPRSGRCLNRTAPVAMQPLAARHSGGILSCLPGSHLEIWGSTSRSSTARLGSIWWPGNVAYLLHEVGQVSCDPATEIPLWRTQLERLPEGLSGQVRLVWQLSNHHFVRGGPVNTPVLSAHSGLAQRALLGTLWGAGLVGLLLVLAIYHFSIAYERREREPRGILHCSV